MLKAFIHGIILAFGLIMPLGIQNIFIFNQGATQPSYRRALPTVLTAFVCDALLILLAVLGVSLIVMQIVWLKQALLIFGFCFLTYIGWLAWQSKIGQSSSDSTAFSIKKQIGFTLSISLLNPHAIIDTVGVIGTDSLQFTGNDKWMFTAACILVSLIWFVSLAFAGRCIRSMDNTGRLQHIINKISAIIIWVVATYLGFFIFSGFST